MRNIFDKFNGIKPITDADLLPPTFAQTAHNLKLDSGKITTCLESLTEYTLPDTLRNSIYRYKVSGKSLNFGLSASYDTLKTIKDGIFNANVGGTTYFVNSGDLSVCANKVEIASAFS